MYLTFIKKHIIYVLSMKKVDAYNTYQKTKRNSGNI